MKDSDTNRKILSLQNKPKTGNQDLPIADDHARQCRVVAYNRLKILEFQLSLKNGRWAGIISKNLYLVE